MVGKICAQGLEKILPLSEGSKNDNDDLILYSGDISCMTIGNFKSYGSTKMHIIKGEYKKHIPNCNECTHVYISYLWKNKKEEESVIDMDERIWDVFYSKNRVVSIKIPAN